MMIGKEPAEMKSSITCLQEDIDLLLVTIKFTFDSLKGPALRKKMEALGYKMYPMDKARMSVNGFVAQAGQANTSIRNEFTILRHYEIPQDFDEHLAEAKEHAERYYRRVLEDLQGIE
jgi:hypothetical protein